MQIGLPITGKYRDPESDQYYNNQHVRTSGHLLISRVVATLIVSIIIRGMIIRLDLHDLKDDGKKLFVLDFLL